MLNVLLIIIGCYAAAALLVHLAHWIGRGKSRKSKHYVLIADKGQAEQMEWYLRMLHAFSRWIGKDVRLTVVDRGASDETLAIVERWRRSGKQVHVHAQKPQADTETEDGKRLQGNEGAVHMMWMLQAEGVVSESEHAVLVDLQNPADLSKMPF
ncbi:hypothetical protein [Paenibacillus soyae]|uniref:Uncharacterized protein n=1 Tax=Paenibacillus soyae TaxID=2969249 RepID=A0A9X2MR54_9BACL|nr:hypothetical protein [Paenibacillus soyae]MCR2806743.1 hypothetical protein [Paenibacillus soyae]